MNPTGTGARRRMAFIPKVLRATAFISSSCPTISAIIAWRDGIISPMIVPCRRAAIIRINQEPGRSSLISPRINVMATPREITAEAACPTQRTYFFWTRSAMTPPKREKKSMGAAFPRAIRPRAAPEPVRW